MRKASSVILKVISGFFFYMVSLLAFISTLPTGGKLGILFGFSIPAVLALIGGLALSRFHNWKRDTGIVLLSASGFTAFLIFSLACMLMSEEFRIMMKPDTLTFFSDYWTGGGLIVGLAGLGWALVKTKNAEQVTTLD